MIILKIICAVLAADFLSGLFHWLEDAYGRENWPITGQLVTKPNILHHHDPRYFTRHGWLQSSWLLACFGLLVLAIAWLCGVLTWEVWLVVILGINANQIHKWAHRTPRENGPTIALLQHVRLVQTPRHHALHHTDPKNSHYCVLTNFLNPILDGLRLWDGLEWLAHVLFGVRRRTDTSVLINPGSYRTATNRLGLHSPGDKSNNNPKKVGMREREQPRAMRDLRRDDAVEAHGRALGATHHMTPYDRLPQHELAS